MIKSEQEIKAAIDNLKGMVIDEWDDLTEPQRSSLASIVLTMEWVLGVKTEPIDELLNRPIKFKPENN